MLHDCSVMLFIANRLDEYLLGDVMPRQREVSERTKMLRFCLLGCAIENALRMFFPCPLLPRFLLHYTVDQYGETCAYTRARIEYHRPELLDLFDSVV
jgi:hypothetical protein